MTNHRDVTVPINLIDVLDRVRNEGGEPWERLLSYLATEGEIIASVSEQIIAGVDDSGNCGETNPTIYDKYPTPLDVARRWIIQRADAAAADEVEELSGQVSRLRDEAEQLRKEKWQLKQLLDEVNREVASRLGESERMVES